MGKQAESADRAPPSRIETVHEGERTRVTRLFFREHTVICKEPVGPDFQRRVEHEVAILERLRGVVGVAQLDERHDPGSITLADGGFANLAQAVKPLPLDDLIGLAEQLACALAGMHGRGVMHRDICPANIVTSSDGVPCLVGFGSATWLAEIHPEFGHHGEIVGTPSYAAPEQTGRTGRSVDHRADLYSLGATLYELATGSPPFDSKDPLRLTRDHLSRLPRPANEVNLAVPPVLSEIIAHLLEKEPDDRYQSADGLVHDLRQARKGGDGACIGERDFPLRLVPPSRLIGRDDELTTLKSWFDRALRGDCHGVFVGGPPGVGKTALVDRLRLTVTGNDGWFVAGKFDQHRRDLEFDGIFQAFRALGRLLLAEPENELVDLRQRMLAQLGGNAGMAAAVLPEFAALLGVPPEAGDPLTAQTRVQRSAVDTLRAVASRKRPVLLFVDDLQWASPTALGVIEVALHERVDGLLLVGAYRDELEPAHPLASSLKRWRDGAGVTELGVANLPGPDLTALIAEMLRVDDDAAGALADLVHPHTHGNPYETAEILNTLRQEGVLTPTSTGWRWDEPTLRSHLTRSSVTNRPMPRLAAIPPASRKMVEAMACLGGRAEITLLAAATGESADMVEQLVAPALEERVLTVETGVHDGVRFRHDRIREAVLAGLDPTRRQALQLSMARRLAAVPELFAVAAEQYLPVVGEVDDAGERSRVVALLRRAAEQAALVGGYTQVHTLLTAALRLADADDSATLIELRTGDHAALYGLGRLEEADEDYRAIERLSTGVLQRVDATCVQVRSLTSRKALGSAIELAVEALRELGVTVSDGESLPRLFERYFDYQYRWLDQTDVADDLARPEITDPILLAVTDLLNAAFPPAHWAGDLFTRTWLSTEAMRILLEHGTGRGVLFPVSYSTVATIALRDDYDAAYRVVRRILALGNARGYEPEASQARFAFSRFSCWFEPLEISAGQAVLAYEGLIKGGDMATAGYAFIQSITAHVDCAPRLDIYVEEVNKALAFAHHVGIDQMDQWVEACSWLADVLRGEEVAAVNDMVAVDRYTDNPTARYSHHVTRAIAAAILDDHDALTHHTAAVMQSLDFVPGNYATALGRFLRGLALADNARTAAADERSDLLTELEEVIQWVSARAADAPENFGHLLRLLEAERAWATGELGAAALAFDVARGEVAGRRRPWHGALITERAARFSLAQGLQHAGFELLARARDAYASWGATAKVARMDWAYPALRPRADGDSGEGNIDAARLPASMPSSGTIDLMAILSASQELSSQTSIEGLHGRVTDVLAAMSGATAIMLLLWDDDRQQWLRPAPAGAASSLGGAGSHHDVPMSVLRYAQRLSEPLVVDDATTDDRFGGDPYFTDVDRCSLVALPIVSRGRLQAMLLVENRLLRGAFTSGRLDAVRLIAGQLAVSLDNAQLYAELAASRARIVSAADQARRQIERDLHDGAQQRLVSLALELRMAQVEMSSDSGLLSMRLDRAVEQVGDALEELRDLSRGIHPAILTEGGLSPAVRALARRSSMPVVLELSEGERLPDHIEISVYYIVSEALTNAAKHSCATTVRVTVEQHTGDGSLRLEIADNGVGGAEFTGGTGLVGLKDRVEALGGHIELRSPRSAGTTMAVSLPLSTPDSRDPTPTVDRGPSPG